MEEMGCIRANMIVWVGETGSLFMENGFLLLTSCQSVALKMWTLTKEISMVTNFAIFVQRCLVSILQPFNGMNDRSVVVMDNVSIHHVDRVVATIQQTGALLRFLPPYNPDLNSIEEVLVKR